MTQISFMTANYVARQLDYHMPEGWGQGDKATQDYFRPVATYSQRFGDMLSEIRGLGFTAVDIWLAHLHPAWATPDHINIARERLAEHNLTVVSLAGGFGATPEEFAASCKLAVALNTTVLGGNTSLLQTDRPGLVAMLKDNGLTFGLENHPEKNPAEILAKIGEADSGVIGTAVDTGWFGTYGYDAAEALEQLADRLVHIHLKDVLAPGGHDTCRYGLGVVPIERCVQTLRRAGYQGAISVEHEPHEGNPGEDCRASLVMLQEWLQA